MVDCKSDCSGKVIRIFKHANTQILIQGKRHLGAALGTYK